MDKKTNSNYPLTQPKRKVLIMMIKLVKNFEKQSFERKNKKENIFSTNYNIKKQSKLAW